MAHHDVEGGVLGALRNIDTDPQAVLRPEEKAAADATGDDPALILEDRHVAPGRSGANETNRGPPLGEDVPPQLGFEITAVLSFW